MAKLTLSPIGSFSQSAITTINQNMDDIETAVEKTLSRDGTSPNQMEADLDLNGNDILNVDNLDVNVLLIDGAQVIPGDITSGTAAEILTAIKTVDGSGSGLDADLLDGVQGADYVKYTDQDPYVILLSGQSNAVIEETYSWTPSPRLKLWNNDIDTLLTPGTAWISQPNTWINAGIRFASELADREQRDVYVMKLGYGGIPIADFIYGVDQVFDANTAVSDPGTGEIKVNNASLAAATVISASAFDSAGINRTVVWQQAIAGHTLVIRKAGVVTARYLITGAPTNNTTWWSFPVSIVGIPGTISGGNAVQTVGPQDIQAVYDINVPPALALVPGAPTKIDMQFWWQGEADASAPTAYPTDFEEMITINRLKSWYPLNTPILVSGISGSAQMGDPAWDTMSVYLQAVVANDPDRRMFVNPAIYPQAYWDATALYYHMTGAGIDLAGKMFYENFANGFGRKMNYKMVIDQTNGDVAFGGSSTIPLARLSVARNHNGSTNGLFYNPNQGASAAASVRVWSDTLNAVDFFANSVAAGNLAGLNSITQSLYYGVPTTKTHGWHVAGVLCGQVASTGFVIPASKTIEPATNDGAPLGTTSKSFSDLFLATGGVINWNNGTYTITQSGGALTFSGQGFFGGAILPTSDGTQEIGATGSKWGKLWLKSTAIIDFGAGNYTVTHSSSILTFSGAIIALGTVAVQAAILSNHATAGMGYATGAGGVVTQATNRTTGVTINKASGQITTNNTSLAALTTAKFTVTNSAVAATDTIVLSIASGSTTDFTDVRVQNVAAGSFTIVVHNTHAVTAETGAIVINFAILKGVAA